MALHWYPERRARLEASLLERYHAGLCTYGVIGYWLDRLWEDCRLSVLGQLSVPVWQQTLGLQHRDLVAAPQPDHGRFR